MCFIKDVICCVLLLWCGGCSHFYESVQAYNISNCYDLPYSERGQCLEQVEGSYERYQQERKAALPDRKDSEGEPLNF